MRIEASEAAIVREIYSLYTSGHPADGRPMGIKAIVSYLNESGKTRRGVRFRVSSVERILKSTIYTGTYAYNRAPKSEAGNAFGVVIIEVPAIVTKPERSEEHTSELKSLMSTTYAVICLQNKNKRMTTKPEEKK